MSGLGDWAAMGDYAAFVWPAYGVAAVVLGGLTLQSWWRYRASQRDLAALEPPRRAPTSGGRAAR